LKTILILFPNEWDRLELASPRYAQRYRFIFEGFDLHKFPENAKLLTFDALRFIDRMAEKYRGGRIDAVVSNEEQFGTLIASVIAERLRLPSATPASILTAQHKYYARLQGQSVVPEATPAFTVFPYTVHRESDVPAAFPLFVKPVKATYSILARRVDNFRELRALLTFRALETRILKQLVRPSNQLARLYTDFPIDSHHMIGEEVLTGQQVTVDGYLDRGSARILGIVDSIMYPGTSAFQRFEYPSSLPAPVQQRMAVIAEKFVCAMGFEHGAFNVELIYDAARDDIKIIETNPRLAYQFADLYEKVDGFNPYDVMLDLALGEHPSVHARQGVYRNAASFILRAWPGAKLVDAPSRAHLESVRRQHRDARVMIYVKKGASLAREFKWLGSYRYAVLNLGAESNHALFQRFHAVRQQLPFVFS
jgi:hypothetical protein